jgi:tetratricopeptide (TPR) repeat protein
MIVLSDKISFNRVGSVRTLPCLLLLIAIIFSLGCANARKAKEAKARFANLQNEVKDQNQYDTKGNNIDGYPLQDNDRVYFNALKNYLIGRYDTAFVGFNYYNTLDSTNASTYYYLAQIKGRYNYLKETLKDAKRSVELDPDNKWMQSFYAGLLAFSEQYDTAAQIFLKIGRMHLNDRENSFITAARLYQRAGNTQKAISILDTLLSYHNAVDEDILVEKQTIYLKSGKLEEAVEVTQQLIEAYPLSPEYRVQEVEIYELDKDPVQSKIAIQKLEAQFPKNQDVASYIFGYYLKKRSVSEVEQKLNDYLDAAAKDDDGELKILSQIGNYIAGNRSDTTVLSYLSEVTDKIIQDKPENLVAKRLSASLKLYGNNPQQGIQEFNKLIATYPDKYVLWLPLVEHYIYSGVNDTALSLLNKMETQFPDSIDIPMNKMFLAQNDKSFKEALAFGLLGLDLAQKQKNKEKELVFYNSIANFYYELGQYSQSDSVYDAILAKDPENVMALNNYAYFLSERGERLEYALNLSKKSLELDYENSNNLDTYGWILYKLKRYEEAKEYIGKAVAVAGESVSSVVLEHYADVEFKLGNIDDALKIWKIIDQAGEGSPFLKKKIKDKKIYE